MGSKDDPLQGLDPFLGASGAVGPKVILSELGRHAKAGGFLSVLLGVDEGGGDGVGQVDVTAGEV